MVRVIVKTRREGEVGREGEGRGGKGKEKEGRGYGEGGTGKGVRGRRGGRRGKWR